MPDRGPLTHSQMPPKSTQFGRTALPFLAMMGLGSWGLAQFLKMPIDVKDARAKDKREKKEKFDLAKEHEVRPPSTPRQSAAVLRCIKTELTCLGSVSRSSWATRWRTMRTSRSQGPRTRTG